MTFLDAVTRGLGGYVVFTGRTSRPDFWRFWLFVVAALLAALVVESLGLASALLVTQLALTPPVLAAAVRRVHDIDLSGWWLLLPLGLGVAGAVLSGVAGVDALGSVGGTGGLAVVFGMLGLTMLLLGLAIQIRWLTTPGVRGANQFGPDPLPATSD